MSTIIGRLKKAETELEYCQMFVKRLREALERDDKEEAESVIYADLDDYMFKAGSFDAEVYGVDTQGLHSAIRNFLDGETE